MNCAACEHYSITCIKDCLQVHFKDNVPEHKYPIHIHKSEVAYVEIGSRFLSITDIDGVQHNYNCDIISHFHIPNFKNK